MEITCIGHSGFLIELPRHNLIFDYYTDKNKIIVPDIFKDKHTCVFASHNHHDHYNEEIFDWSKWGDITYIVDSGCVTPGNVNIIKVNEGDSLNDLYDGIKVKVYGSTDIGVSFLVMIDDLVIFHAGDLNDWYWEDESTAEELLEYENNYLQIINELVGYKINAAFIPKDPRLGKNADRGVKFFNEIVAPDKIIPMHYPDNEGIKYHIDRGV